MSRSVRDPATWAWGAQEHHYCPDGYDLWGYHRDGHYDASMDRAPHHATPFAPEHELADNYERNEHA